MKTVTEHFFLAGLYLAWHPLLALLAGVAMIIAGLYLLGRQGAGFGSPLFAVGLLWVLYAGIEWLAHWLQLDPDLDLRVFWPTLVAGTVLAPLLWWWSGRRRGQIEDA
ncbi:MAG: hypothetical protein PVJ40_05685 [Gammaproteobacteria bacterium]|jgi:hypothetical protein